MQSNIKHKQTMTTNFLVATPHPAISAQLAMKEHTNRQKFERLRSVRREKMDRKMPRYSARMNFSCPSSALPPTAMFALLVAITACVQTQAYSPSIGITSRRSLALELSSYNGRRSVCLFDTISDVSGGEIMDTTDAQKATAAVSDDGVFDNLLPSSSMAANSLSMSRVVRRPAVGLSSSALLPLSDKEIQQQQPLFQTSNNPMELEYNNNAPTSTSEEEIPSWKDRLVDVSNIASFLCVLDCTLLPLVSVAIPALSWGAGALVAGTTTAASSGPIMAGLSSFMIYLPTISHGIALYFVIPVGILTTLVNYFFGHKEIKFSLTSLVGVSLIYVSNSSVGVGIPSVDAWLHSVGIASAAGVGGHGHQHVHDMCGAVVGAATGMMTHTCPEGLAHRLTNTLGCALLLSSNYYGKKYMEETSNGCAASALAQAWGGDSGSKRMVCPPGCECEAPSNAETFFQWERGSPGGGAMGNKGKGGRAFTRFRR